VFDPFVVGGVDKRTEVIPMSKRTLKAEDVDGFMLAVWDEWVDQERVFGVPVTVRVQRGQKRGTFRFYAAAFTSHPDLGRWAVAEAEMLWPTHKATSIHALLYALLCRSWASLAKEKNGRSDGYGQPGGDQPAKDQ